jgi:eukaryotic-like serine/threonine-protein kinase
MELDRWEQIERLYHAALERGPDTREAFLDEACAGDEDLRREVAGLLACDVPSDSFIQSPAIEIAARAMAAEPPIEASNKSMGSLIAGSQIGAYRLLQPLGRGGMGEVHLALDTRLGRKVALKLLPAAFTTDAGRVRRFAQEARAASSLNHPNIITIHEIGKVRTEAGDTHYIVTEYVDGETLRQRMVKAPQGRLSLSEALDVAAQIATALATAHEAGIAHRDIKPENVMARRDGIVKVLDFGLAKLTEPASPVIDTQASTMARNSTEAGMVMGTPRYMSPEQARGEKVDLRTDIFSLGVMLYEMVAGRPPFTGVTPNETIAAILRDSPPPLAECAPDAPPEMEEILGKALSKNREERYQAVSELLADLKRLKNRLEQDGWLGARSEQTVTSTQPDLPQALPEIASLSSRVFTALRHTRRARAISGIALAVLLGGVWMTRQWWTPSPYSPSPRAKRFYDEGLNALRDGAYYKASRAFEAAVSIDREQAIPHARLAETWMELDYTDKANYELRRAYTLAPTRMAPVDRLYLEALNRTIDHNFVASIENYRAILEQTSKAEKAYASLDLGRAYERNEEVGQAMSLYKQAKEFDSNYAAAPLRLGLLYSRRQEYDKAAAELAEAEKNYEPLTNAESLNEIRYQQGVLASKRRRFDEARIALQKAHDKAQENEYISQQIAALLQLSLTFYDEGKTVPAREYAQKALDLARNNGLENLTTQGLIDLGNVFYRRREYEEAEAHFNRALTFASAAKGRRMEALARLSLGKLYVQQNIKMDEAERRLDEALTFFQKGGYRKEIAETIACLGQAKLQQGDYAAALRIFDEQLQRANQLDDRSHLARLHRLIGRALADQDVYPKALRHFEQSYSLYHSLGNQQLYVGYALVDRSDMLWRLGRYADARSLLNQVPSVAEQLDSDYKKILPARMHLIYAKILLSERRFSEAIAECQRTIVLDDTPTQYNAAEAEYMLGLAMAFYNRDRKAKRFCEEAIKKANKIGDQFLTWNARQALAQVTMEIGNPAEALTGALEAHDKFALTSNLESQWRAACLVALASYQTNNHSSARKYAAHAESLLSTLRQRWAEDEAFESYLARPDIDHYRKQLRTVSTSIQSKGDSK